MLFSFLLVTMALPGALAGTYSQADSLVTDRLANYNTGLRPLRNQSEIVNVFINIMVYTITDIDPIKGMVTFTVGFRMSWYDKIIVWNVTDYDGIKSVFLEPQQVWTPCVVIVSSLDGDILGEDNRQRLLISSNGLVFWNPGLLVKLICTFYMKFWPFDKQECNLVLAVNGDNVNEVQLHFMKPAIDVSQVSMSEWILDDTGCNVNAFYSSFISCRLKFKRQPAFYVLTLILPVAFLGFLIPFVFILPSESGERIGFSITIMLSLTVFLTVISDEIPRTTNPVALICGYVMCLTLSSVLVTVLTIINLRLHNKTDGRPVGKFWQMLCGRKSRSTNDTVRKIFLNRIDSAINDMSKPDLKVSENADIEDSREPGSKLDMCHNTEGIARDDKCSWQDVSKTIDKILFIVTSVMGTFLSVTFLSYLSIASDYDPNIPSF